MSKGSCARPPKQADHGKLPTSSNGESSAALGPAKRCRTACLYRSVGHLLSRGESTAAMNLRNEDVSLRRVDQ